MAGCWHLLKRLYCPSYAYETRPQFNRWVYFIAAIIQTLTAGGLLFGWANLEQILKREGYFDEECSAAELDANDCDSRTLKLSNVYLAGSITAFVASPISGTIIDKLGPRAATTFGAFFYVLFYVFAGFSNASRPYFMLPAYVCLGVQTNAVLFSTLSVGNLFPSHSSTVISTISGGFDAATVMFLIWNSLSSSFGYTMNEILTVYGSTFGVIVVICCLFVWPSRPFAKPGSPEKEGKEPSIDDGAAPAAPSEAKDAALPTNATAIVLPAVHSHPEEPSSNESSSSADLTQKNPLTEEHGVGAEGAPVDAQPAPVGQKTSRWSSPEEFLQLPLSKQLRSPEAISFFAWMSVSLLKFNYVFASIDSQLTKLGQDDGEYTNIFGIIVAAGTAVVPFLGLFMGKFGFVVSAWVLWSIGLLQSICLTIPVLELQIVTSLLFVLFRGWLFAFMSSYISHAFGFGTFSRIVGLAVVVGAGVSFLQYPLIDLALVQLDGDYLASNLIVVGLSIGLAAFPITLTVMSRKRSSSLQRKASPTPQSVQ